MSAGSAHLRRAGGRVLGVGALVVWTASLLAAVVTTLPAGPVEQWLVELPPEAAFLATTLRLAVLISAMHLLGATLVALVREAGGAARPRRPRRWASPALVHRLAAAAVGTSLAAGIVGPTGSSAAGATPNPVEISAEERDDREVAVLTHVGPSDDGESPTHHTAEARIHQNEAVGTPAEEWPVAPGDHLWHVAERTLEVNWGRAVTDAEVDPYWREVVAANRSRLVDPTNPDLVLPGQSVVVPPPPASPPQKSIGAT